MNTQRRRERKGEGRRAGQEELALIGGKEGGGGRPVSDYELRGECFVAHIKKKKLNNVYIGTLA